MGTGINISRLNGIFFRNDWNITLTSPATGSYSGQINCNFSEDPTWLIAWSNYYDEATTPFQAVINFEFKP